MSRRGLMIVGSGATAMLTAAAAALVIGCGPATSARRDALRRRHEEREPGGRGR